jgi:arylsulfatase A-like enzyme
VIPGLLLAAAVALLALHARQLQFFCDDSYISYRYEQNLAEGRGLVYNAGERVEGYTNFLWVILIGLGIRLGFAAEPVSLWLGLFFLVVALSATAVLAKRLLSSFSFALVPVLLLVCQGPMVLWSVSGLEASFFAAMTLLAVLAYERGFLGWKGQLLAGALYAISTMVRPDGAVFGAAAGLHLVLCALFQRPRDLAGAALRAAALATGFLALFTPFVLWRWRYYGDWLPNTFYVKAGGLLNLSLGLQYLETWFVEYPIAGSLSISGTAAVLLLPRWREQRRTFGHVALALLLFSAYLVWAGGDYMALYRFLVPLLPLAMLPAAALLQMLFEGAAGASVAGLPASPRDARLARETTARVAAALGLALLALAGWLLWIPSLRSLDGVERTKAIATVRRMKRNSAQWAALGKAVKEKLPPHYAIATTAAGALPFFSGLPTIDESGLCDRHTAKVQWDPWLLDRPGHMKQATRAWLAQRRPEVVFWHPKIEEATTPPEQFPTPPSSDYELRAMAVPELADEGLCAFFWVRKDVVPALAQRGVVPARESTRLAAAPAAQAGSDRAGGSFSARRDARAAEIEADLAALDAEPPPAPPAVDPPPPPPRSGPVFTAQRVGAADPAAKELRWSVDHVTRPLWEPHGFEIEISGAPGSFLELDVASAPRLEGEGDAAIVRELAGARKPATVAVAWVRDGARHRLPTSLSEPPFAGPRCWRTLRAELGGAPAGRGTLEIAIDGAPARKGGGWLLSVPRFYQRASEESRPNVLILTIDTLRADYLGCYGHDRPTSPNIDRLASGGVLFQHALSQASWTLPSYSSFFTGLFVESHGVVHREHGFPHRFRTFVEELAQAGYTTGAVASGTFTDAFWGFDQGFDSYDDLGMVAVESTSVKVETAEGQAPAEKEAMKKAAHRRITSPEVANKAIAWLDAHRERRFALFVHFFDPHEDYLKHPGISERFPDRPVPSEFPNQVDPRPQVTARMRARYEGEIAYTDLHVGRVLARLAELGLERETIVVLFSDHGEAFKEHVLDPRNDERNVGHGSSLFNEQVRVPLILRVPGVEPGRVRSPVGNLDVGPTLLELCGLDASGFVGQARSLKPLLEDKEAQREEPVLSAQYAMNPRRELPPDRQKEDRVQVAHRLDRPDLCAIEYEPNGRQKGLSFLFDLSDRWQDYVRDRSSNRRDDVERFRSYYARRRAELEALLQPADGVDTGDLEEVLSKLGYAK